MKQLLNKTIVLTNNSVGDHQLSSLEDLGAITHHIPFIQTNPTNNVITTNSNPNWIIVTSATAVPYITANLLGTRPHIASVGPTTSEALRQAGMIVDFESPIHTAEALGNELPIAAGEEILFPCSSSAGRLMEEILIQRGAKFNRWECYETGNRGMK